MLDALLAPLRGAERVLLAVSGGPDSIALMHLFARWQPDLPRPRILVATVDHGLRSESADEAVFVAREAAALGFPHKILVWTGPKPETGLQEVAREARYRLLVQHAREQGATHLATAHTLDDQAETVLMRMARGSGLSGLAGMRRERDCDGIRHVRPLLDIPKQDLLALCESEGWRFVTDPSNTNERFARVRWRKLIPSLAAEGLTAERLFRLAERIARADEALEAKAADAFCRAEPVFDGKALDLKAAFLADEPNEIALRVLMKALSKTGIGLEASRLNRLEACLERLQAALAEGEGLRLTIAGALIRLDRAGTLSIRPEPPRRRGR